MGTSTLTKHQARGRDNAIVGPEHRCSHPPNALDEVALRVQVKSTHPISPPAKSDPPKQRKNDNDNQIRDERRLHYPAPVMDSS